MKDEDWAPYRRIQDQLDKCTDANMSFALEDALNREIAALARGAPRVGSPETSIANARRKERHRRRLLRAHSVTHVVPVDPLPALAARSEIAELLSRLKAPSIDLLLTAALGDSLEDMSIRFEMPIGTIKARLHRARARRWA